MWKIRSGVDAINFRFQVTKQKEEKQAFVVNVFN